MTEVSYDIFEECRSGMIHNNMDISQLMVHIVKVGDARLKRKNSKFKRSKDYEGGTFKGRLEIQEKPRFKKRVSNQVSSNFV